MDATGLPSLREKRFSPKTTSQVGVTYLKMYGAVLRIQ